MTAATEIRLRRAENQLHITFDNGAVAVLAAEYLRVESPSAEVQGHTPADKRLVAGKQDVGIVAVEPVGHYAISLRFSDGHDTGIYTWDFLLQLDREQPERWPAYLRALEQAGLSRQHG